MASSCRSSKIWMSFCSRSINCWAWNLACKKPGFYVIAAEIMHSWSGAKKFAFIKPTESYTRRKRGASRCNACFSILYVGIISPTFAHFYGTVWRPILLQFINKSCIQSNSAIPTKRGSLTQDLIFWDFFLMANHCCFGDFVLPSSHLRFEPYLVDWRWKQSFFEDHKGLFHWPFAQLLPFDFGFAHGDWLTPGFWQAKSWLPYRACCLT